MLITIETTIQAMSSLTQERKLDFSHGDLECRIMIPSMKERGIISLILKASIQPTVQPLANKEADGLMETKLHSAVGGTLKIAEL